MMIAAMALTACKKEVKPTPKPNDGGDEEQEYVAPITIDGDFADWAKLDASKVITLTSNANAAKKALKVAKIYADAAALFVYVEFDAAMITWSNVEGEEEWVPFHLYFDADNSTTTGGFNGEQWTDGGFDALFEGFLTDGNGLAAYDPGVYAWNGEVGGNAWAWDVDSPLATGGVCSGAGKDNKYEIMMLRDMYPGELADPFVLGIDIQQGWSTVGYLPNTDAEAEPNKVPGVLVKANK